jgi:hypothetical protein
MARARFRSAGLQARWARTPPTRGHGATLDGDPSPNQAGLENLIITHIFLSRGSSQVGAPLVGVLVRVAKGTHHPEGTRCPYQKRVPA